MTLILDDDDIIVFTTDATVYEGCADTLTNPSPPPVPPVEPPPDEDFVPFLVIIIE